MSNLLTLFIFFFNNSSIFRSNEGSKVRLVSVKDNVAVLLLKLGGVTE